MNTLHLTIFVTMIITIGLISSLPIVFAEESITVSTDKSSYRYGENYTISGKVNPVVLDQAISIVVLSPNYPHPESLSTSPNSDGRYSYTMPLTISDISSANFTVIAQYAGAKNQTTFSYTGLPCNQQSIPNHVYAPIIRGPPVYNPRLLDSLGNAIIGPVKVGQQIQITYTLANGLNCAQPFAYIVQIQDINSKTVSLSWITGTLLAGQSLNPAQSWTPQHNGTYTAQIFTWQSIDNPNALGPPAIFSFDVEPNSNLTQSSQLAPRISSNCNEGFIHIIKSEDGSPACVKPDTAQILVQRGWAEETSSMSSNTNSIRDTSFINLFLTTNSTIIRQGQTIGVDIWINNTSGNKMTMNYDDHWPWKRLILHPCVVGMPFGVALLDGNYSLQNLTISKQLSLYQNGIYHCPMERYDKVNTYVFEPSSDNATLETPDGNFTSEIRYSLLVNGFYSSTNDFQALAEGEYTIVAGDEWGHLAIQHFQVTNSTLSNEIQTSQIIPSCVTNIQNQYAIAGAPGFFMCPITPFQATGQIIHYAGFYGVYNYTKFPDVLNFVLEPGHNGTITYTISTGTIHNLTNVPEYPNKVNVPNDVTFMHDAEMYNHPGVDVLANPLAQIVGSNESISVNFTFSASKFALPGTYWVRLPPGICSGGDSFILTITDCTGKK